MDDRTITISPKVSRETYFKFRDLCHAHGMTVQRGVEQAMQTALERAGVSVGERCGTTDDRSRSGN